MAADRTVLTCIWLDNTADSTEENKDIQQKLRQIVENLRTFNNVEVCESYLRKNTKETIILIVSGSFGRQIIPLVHDLSQLINFYVFCQDRKANEQWAKKHHKLGCVCTVSSELIDRILKNHNTRTGTEDNPLISVISSDCDNIESRNAVFMWFQLFIEVLLRMHHKVRDRKEFINICKQTYPTNGEVLQIIDEFEEKYSANEAIWWYTRDTCFYRMINKALRTQDFDMLFIFRSFITDIAKQIQEGYEYFIRTTGSRNKFEVYRGQMISVLELELMQNNIEGFLSMNSFLSTSRERSVALQFARGKSRIQPIIFEIEIDPRLRTKAFVDISKKSDYQGEHEILIMIGALFCIKKVTEDPKDKIWVARVSLASDDDYHLKELFAHMKSKIGDDTDLDTLGKLLLRMDKNEQARKCYKRMLNETQIALGNAQLGLGWTSSRYNDLDASLEHFQASLEIRQRLLGENHPDVAEIYSFLGEIYRKRSEYDEALKYLVKAMKIEEKTLPPNSLNLAATYDTIGMIYIEIDNYDTALIYLEKVLRIRQKALPSNHPQIASINLNFGWLYECQGDYSKALDCYQKSLGMAQKTLSPTHRLVVTAQNSIQKLKTKMKQ